MRGRQVLMQTLRAHGVDRIFGNPGTTESPLLDSLPNFPEIEYIVHLHEGVAVGAANFYAQASGKTAFVNLHVAPGLGNAIGMIYNALKNNSPMVVTAGQQDTRARLRDPVLGHDLAAMAAPVTKWSVQVERADELGPILQRAFRIARQAPAGPVFVALPIDVMEQEASVGPTSPSQSFEETQPDPQGIAAMARLLMGARRPAIVAGDDVARAAGGNDTLVKLAERTGAAVWYEGIRGRNPFPGQHAQVRGVLAFDAAALGKQLAPYDLVLMIGGPFFEEVWYAPGSPFTAGTKLLQIEAGAARLGRNFTLDAGLLSAIGPALVALDAAVAAAADAGYQAAARLRCDELAKLQANDAQAQKSRLEKAWARSPMSMPRAMAELRAGAPGDVVVVDETITAGPDLLKAFGFAGPGDYFSGRGGGIGQGLAGAVGVAVGQRRPVLCVSGDGSSMYSIQALWTAAHHALPIVFVILANREYRVLKHNIDAYRQKFAVDTTHPYQHMDLTGPVMGFVDLARGMGVAGTRVTEADALRAAVAAAFASGKPHLIEVEIEGKR